MSQPIAGLPATHDPFASVILVEFERRTAIGMGTYSSVFYRYTNAVQQITYNGAAGSDRPAVGAVFTRLPFIMAAITMDGSMGASTEITFDDQQDVIKTLAIAYDWLDWKARVWEMGVDAVFVMTWIKLKIGGRPDSVDWDVADQKNDVVVSILHDAAYLQQDGPREDYSPTCRFRFKSSRCGYVGVAATCDRSLTNCTALANQQRFGGFPNAPTPGSKLFLGSAGQFSYPSRDQVLPPLDPSAEG